MLNICDRNHVDEQARGDGGKEKLPEKSWQRNLKRKQR